MKRNVFIGIIAVLLIILIITGVYFYRIRTRNAIEVLVQKNKLINILVAGNINDTEDTNPFYSIISINPENGNTGITFIPPSYLVRTDEDKSSRIDSIDFEDDLDIITDSIYRDIHLKISFYMQLYQSDVRRMVDILEGVDLYILDQAKNLTGTCYGINYLDGNRIIHYIVNSQNQSIYQKYDRIQDVLLTFFYKKDTYRKFVSTQFASEMLRSVKTNILPQEALTIVEILYKSGNLHTSVLPGRVDENGGYYVDQVTYKIYEESFLKPIVLNVNNESSIKVKILNGTMISGLAKKMRNMLTREGLTVVEFGTSPFPLNENTVIINQKGSIEQVRNVSSIIGVDRIYHVIDTSQLNDILIIIGKDFAL